MPTSASARTVILVVAAGRGVRAGGGLPKQYRLLGGEPILRQTLRTALVVPDVDAVGVIIHPDDGLFFAQATDGLAGAARLLPPILGGDTRQASVRAGLEMIASLAPEYVLIHDAVRPFAPQRLFAETRAALASAEGAIAALAVTDTLKRTEAGRIVATIPRDAVYAAQTPQAFRFSALRAAHARAAATPEQAFTDDASLIEWVGGRVVVVPGDAANMKLTSAEDFARAEAGRHQAPLREIRTGIGYDVHQFTTGDHVMLAGVRIPHTHGVLAHSDGDVALHALTDALLGALGDGDIGVHFPPTDPRWRGASSLHFLADAALRVRDRGAEIVNVDVTVLAEAPRVGPYRMAMQTALAGALNIAPGRVSVKATTTEKMGFVGRREGLAAMAITTLSLPFRP
jgi:2-C-methyl-D-erythritol 4-phosphate cytidylyltransferase/2-C-methyl-D-erythritol 2,4-cyclodiphosphate synthase